ncbi:MAG TPA: glycosyltransferase family 4 protein [bacterium]|nr:glycosyltransferase family 4 protein [bacterium]
MTSSGPPPKFRLAYLVSHPIQYQVPLLQRLAAHPQLTLHVYYMNDQGARPNRDPEFGVSVQWDIPLLEGYPWTLLRNRSPWPGGEHLFGYIHPSIAGVLARERYDAVVVHGYAHATEWLGFLGAWRSGTPILLRGESTLLGRRAPWVAAAKRLALGSVLRRIRGALAIGMLNREFYRAYGVPDDRIFWVPYAVDNARFRADADRWGPSRAALREALGLPRDLPVVLYAGKLVSRKRPLDLLEAYARVTGDHPSAMVFLGEGAERQRLEAAAAQRGLSRVSITGFVNQGDIGRYYAAADILVLPSEHEPWGLVLNEGMCFGLPLIASDAVGAVPDLVRAGENGFVYPVGDVPALADALRHLLADPARRARMGVRSREIVAAYSYDADVDGILMALHRVTAGPRLGIAW